MKFSQHSKLGPRSALIGLALLGIVLTTQACQTHSTEAVAEYDAGALAVLCTEVWTGIDYSSTEDSPETIAGVRANNRAHAAYCEGVDTSSAQ